MRDDNYLQQRLDYIWDRYFSDIEQRNDVIIRFGRKAKTRLGSIKQLKKDTRQVGEPRFSNNKFQTKTKFYPLNQKSKFFADTFKNILGKRSRTTRKSDLIVFKPSTNPTIITINGLFKDKAIPEFLIDSVIAHEMVHYAHGFASPHKRKYINPHAGGVIKREMVRRGLEDLFILQKRWLKENWKDFVDRKLPRKVRA